MISEVHKLICPSVSIIYKTNISPKTKLEGEKRKKGACYEQGEIDELAVQQPTPNLGLTRFGGRFVT